MANAQNNGIDRKASVIQGIFEAQLPFLQVWTRWSAWLATYRIEYEEREEAGGLVGYYLTNRTWMVTLGDAFIDGTMPQAPAKCFRLNFLNIP